MFILDTDHVSVLQFPDSERADQLIALLRSRPDEELAISIITFEEQVRGWLSFVARSKDARKQVFAYRKLELLLRFFQNWTIVSFDEPAADVFIKLRSRKLRVGTQDLKIASIAIARGATLLSANVRDYRLIPGIRVEDWTARV